jgi:hypothetical protein
MSQPPQFSWTYGPDGSPRLMTRAGTGKQMVWTEHFPDGSTGDFFVVAEDYVACFEWGTSRMTHSRELRGVLLYKEVNPEFQVLIPNTDCKTQWFIFRFDERSPWKRLGDMVDIVS